MNVTARHLNSGTTLAELLDGIAAAPPIPLTGIASDSRQIAPGQLFLACRGLTSHGLEFVQQAAARGAAAVAFDPDDGAPAMSNVPAVPVPGLDRRIGDIANRWYGFPSASVGVVGVTGTNGKTTVAWLVRQCFGLAGTRCAYVGTLGSGFEGDDDRSTMTTPACVELHGLLADFRDRGARYAAIEVSSHALTQRRVDGMQFDAAIFTNLSRDHIDYHGGMREYFEAKASLFLEYSVANRIVSVDTEFGSELARRAGPDVVMVATRLDRAANGSPFVFVRRVVHHATGSHIVMRTSWGDTEIALPLPGHFNVANAAQVFALLLCHGYEPAAAKVLLERVTAPPGRMERVGTAGDSLPAVYVDYSHTPASLEAALKALRFHCRGKLWCVFGCGGDRDRGKRPMMGKIAARLSDRPIVTSDNPRGEDPQAIIDEILSGMQAGTPGIVDRRDAIAFAIASAGPTDTVLIAGKGHEDYQIIGDRRLPFSDQAVAAECLAGRDGGAEG